MKRWPREDNGQLPTWAVVVTLAAFFIGLALALVLP